MLFHQKQSKITLAIVCSSLLITACGDHKSDNEKPDNNSSIFDPVQGYWHKTAYGEFIHIDKEKIDLYEFNSEQCLLTQSYTYTQAEQNFTKIEHLPDNTMATYSSGDINPEIWDNAGNMPVACQGKTKTEINNDPQLNFDYFWHSFNDYYAFFAARNVDWQQLYQDYRPLITPETTNDQLFEIFSAMVAPLEDAHVFITSDDDEFSSYKSLPILRSIISAVKSSALEGEQTSLEEAQAFYFAAYNNVSRGYVSNSHGQFPQDSESPTILWGKTDNNVGLIVLNNMAEFSAIEDASEQALIDACQTLMTQVMTALKDTDALIIDIRNNLGGNDSISDAIAAFFLDKPVSYFKQAKNNSGQGLAKTIALSPTEDAYIKPVYLLTSQVTMSAGEIFTLIMKELEHVTLVGEATYGAFSDVLTKTLPNGWELGLSNEVYADQQGEIFEGHGISPDHEIPAFSIQSLETGVFESYQYVLEQLAKDNKPTLSQNEFETQLTALMQQGKLPGISISIVKSGDIVYENGFGKADENNTPVTENTPFYLASVSKTLLGATLAHAAAADKISLDEAITPLLGFDINYPNDDNFELTFRHLITHTSGIIDEEIAFNCSYYLVADHSSLSDLFSDEALCPAEIDPQMGTFFSSYLTDSGELYKENNFSSYYDLAPGEAHLYSNFSAALAAYALEKKSGTPFPELSHQYVFTPLGMTNTRWSVEPSEQVAASRYYVDDETNTPQPLPDYAAITYPDGAAISSSHDLAIFISAVMNQGQYQGKQLLSKAAVAQMITNQTGVEVEGRGMGYFWELDGFYFSHTGGDPGVLSHLCA